MLNFKNLTLRLLQVFFFFTSLCVCVIIYTSMPKHTEVKEQSLSWFSFHRSFQLGMLNIRLVAGSFVS